MTLQREREKAKKERKKEKKKEKRERKEKSREDIRNHLKRKRQHDEACLLHPRSGDVPSLRSDEQGSKKRQCNETIMLHESGNIPKNGFIDKQLGGTTVTEGRATIYNPVDTDGESRKNVEQTAVTKISVVLRGSHQKFREGTGNHIKWKRPYDEACLLHPSKGDHSNSVSNEHHNKRQCTEIATQHESGDMKKEGFIEKEQLGGSAVTEEQGEATLYMHNSFDSQDGVNKKDSEKTDVTKNYVGGGLRIRVPLPKHKETQSSNQICESQAMQCSPHAAGRLPPITQHAEISPQVCKTGADQQFRSQTRAVAPLSSGLAGTLAQICGSQTLVQQHGTTINNRVHATNRQAGPAHVRPHELHSSVIKQYKLHDDASKWTGRSSEMFRTDTMIKQHPAPVTVGVCSASREAGAAPVRQQERPASVGSCTLLQQNGAPAMGRVSAAKRQPEAAPDSRPHEVPALALKQQGNGGMAGEQAEPSRQISGSGTMVRRLKAPANVSMSAANRHDKGLVVTQDVLPTSIIKRQGHHHAAGTPPQSSGNGAIVEKPKAPVKIRVSAANRQAGAVPFGRQDEPPASVIKSQAPVTKQEGRHGEQAGRTSPQTRVNGAVVEKYITPGEACLSTDSMQTGAAPVRHDVPPISVNKQLGRCTTIENIHDFSSFPTKSHPAPCASVVEQTKELPSSSDCSKPPAANIKKADSLSVSKQEKDLTPSFHCLPAGPSHNKRPESAVASVVQPVTPDNMDEPSFSGRKEKSRRLKGVATTSVEGAEHGAFRGSSSFRRQEAKYRDLVLNWKAEALRTELLPGDNDLEWLFQKAEKPLRHAITGCQFDNVEGTQPKVISPSWPPRASLLPEVDLHALPFVVPF